MSEVRNCSSGLPPTEEDLAYRQRLLHELVALTGRETININDGRAWFAVPMPQYLAHVETSALEKAVDAVRWHAWIVARAVARLDPSQFGFLGLLELREFSENLRNLVEAPADFRGLMDGVETALGDLPVEGAQEPAPVDVLAPEADGKAGDELFQSPNVGEDFAPVVQVHPDPLSAPLTPRRATPPP